VFHSSLLAAKSVDLMVARDGFLYMRNGNGVVATLITEVLSD